MGRPLNKKYFGRRDNSVGGFYSSKLGVDAGLAGTDVASLTIGTPGTYAAGAPSVSIAAPQVTNGVTATAVPIMTAVSATIGGTQTVAYPAGTGTISSTGGTGSANVSTWTPTLTSYSGFSIASITAGGVVTLTGGTITAIQGTSVTFNAGLTGSTGLVPGATYYITASVSASTTVTLASTYALAVAGTAIAIAGGTPTGTLTLTIGTTYASVASVAVAVGGAYYTTTTSAIATTNTGLGSGLQLTVTYGVSNALIIAGTLSNVTTAVNGAITFNSLSYVLPPNTAVAIAGSTGGIAPGTYFVAASPSPTLTTCTLVTTQNGSTNPASIIGVVTGVTFSMLGDGYLTTNFKKTPTITGTTVTTITSGAYGTLTAATAAGAFTIGTAQAAGTFYVGQILTLTGTLGGAGTITGYSTGNSYIVSATNGTSTFTLTSLTGAALTTGAGAITGLSIVFYTVTVNNIDGLTAGLKVVTTGSAGGLTAGTYYIISGEYYGPNGNAITLSATQGGNAFVITSTTTSQTITTVVTANAPTATFSSGAATATVVLNPQVTTGYSTNADYPGIVCQANINGQIYELCSILKQEGTRTFRVIPQGGTYPGTLCKLVTSQATLLSTPGTMVINATDSSGGTYYVGKIMSRKAVIVPITGTTFPLVGSATGTFAPWVMAVATPAANQVVIDWA